MTPEALARQRIDDRLAAAGWLIRDVKQLNLGAGPGVAVREYPTDTGPADYVLFINRNAVGVIEAKRDSAGENLTATEAQTERYASANLKWRKDSTPLRFLFEATGQNHARLRQIATDHPADITKMLASLVRDGLLTPQGTGRGMVYYLPWEPQAASMGFAAGETPLTPELNPLTPEQPDSAPVAAPGPTVISDLTQMNSAELARLRALAAPVAERGRASPELVQQTVLALCADRYLP